MFVMHKGLYLVFTTVVWFALTACQSNNSLTQETAQIKTQLLKDHLFPEHENYDIETFEEVFALDEEMTYFVHKKLIPERNYQRRARKLLKHLFSKENINIAYKNNANLTASQAYHSQMANCMSLTIMAYALATEAGLDINFQSIKVPEYWVRNGEYNMLTGHVNLAITEKRQPNKLIAFGEELLQIDFDPSVYKSSFPKKIISKKDMLAVFYNNKGADALVNHNYPLAYRYFKASIFANPDFSSAWGNLGILYRLSGQLKLAEQSYLTAIEYDSKNLTAYRNMAKVLKIFGEDEKVAEIEDMLHKERFKNPYYHALLADEAFYRGEHKEAITLYKKALRLDGTGHEFYYGLAKAYFAINETERAKKALKKAISYNRFPSTENQYTAKLHFLNKQGK